MHDGAKNSYSFKDNVTFKIQSLLKDGEMNSSRPNVLMVSEKEFMETLEEGEGVGFSLVLKPKEESVDKIVKKEKNSKGRAGVVAEV